MGLENYTTIIGLLCIGVLLFVVLGAGLLKRRPKPLKHDYFQGKWKDLQLLCKDPTTWPLAIINADKLLDDALRKRKFKGKTMGERLVSAQRRLSNNDAIWFGHKLRNRLVHEADTVKLKETDVKQALQGFRQALKDLGALPR